jgi:hypothetical protein
MSIYLVSTRFNNETWEENSNYRVKHKINCIYGAPLEFSPHICVDANVFVVEMNNTENKIEGIGLVKNRPCMDKYYKIYNEDIYIKNLGYLWIIWDYMITKIDKSEYLDDYYNISFAFMNGHVMRNNDLYNGLVHPNLFKYSI